MIADDFRPASPRDETAEPVRLVCAQVHGGNGRVRATLDLPDARGILFSQPSEGREGGDVYYVSVCGSGLISRFCVADVVGHGQTVSAVSAEIHAVLRRLMNWIDHRRVLTQLNRLLTRKGLDAMTTLAVMTYFPPSRTLSFSYAGHPPGWYYSRREGRWSRLDLPPEREQERRFVDGALAVVEDACFTRSKRRVDAGDRLILLTDGTLETPRPDREQFGEARLAELLNEHQGLDLSSLAETVVGALESFSGERPLRHDDVTLLLVEFKPSSRLQLVLNMMKTRVVHLLGRSDRPRVAAMRPSA